MTDNKTDAEFEADVQKAKRVLAQVRQEYAYATYMDNIRYSQTLDAILGSAPGYLKN